MVIGIGRQTIRVFILKSGETTNLIETVTNQVRYTKPEQKLKNPSKKTSKIGRFILELTRQIQIKAKCTLRGKEEIK